MPPPKLDAADKALLAAWDAEIDAEDAAVSDLLKTSLREEIDLRAKRMADQAPLGKRLLAAAGIAPDALRKLDDQDFARTKKIAAGAHKRALAVVKKRSAATAAEVRKLLANVKAGR